MRNKLSLKKHEVKIARYCPSFFVVVVVVVVVVSFFHPFLFLRFLDQDEVGVF